MNASAICHVPQSKYSSKQLMVDKLATHLQSAPDIDCDDEKSAADDSDNSSDTSSDYGITSQWTQQRIAVYMDQDFSLNGFEVRFDRISVTATNKKTVLLDSRGFSSGYHEWSVQVRQSDVDMQEIGVIGTRDIDSITVSDQGAFETAGFQSRAAYGCELSTGLLFYGSCNANGVKRCHRDLRPYFNVGWTVGDVVSVRLDLYKWAIKFLLNGEAVRYTMSLEPDKTYYPMICLSGKCKYFLH